MKKVVYVEIDDEVTSIYDQIKRVKQKDIYVVIPRKSILFQSVVNLKILKRKMDEAKKNLYLVTTDRIGKHLAEQAGIPTYEKVKVEEIKARGEKKASTQIEPIQARPNSVLKDIPKRVREKKITIGELIRDFRDQHSKSKKKSTEIEGVYHYVRPNRRFLGFILAVSLGLFFLVTYIVLPGATIYVKPKFDNIEHSINVTLADRDKNQNLLNRNEPNIIASELIETVTQESRTFETTGKRFDGVNASGNITIINTSEDQWTLVAETRFETEEGIIFRIKEPAYVPPQTTAENGEATPGTLEVKVEADPFDKFKGKVGDRGNIEPTRFTIPALSSFNQERIWGESQAPMTGGITRYQPVVEDADIIAAQKQIEGNLVEIAKEQLKEHIESMNQLNETNLVLLGSDQFLEIELQEVRVPENIAGSTQESFEVFAQIKATGIAYDYDQLFELLKKNLKSRTHPDMKIKEESIRPESIIFEPVNPEGYDEALGQIKMTASIEGIQEYVIDDSLQAGVRFTTRMKEKVLGLSIEKAEAYVANLPEVEDVEIKLWPFWLSRIPRIADNIEVKLMEN